MTYVGLTQLWGKIPVDGWLGRRDFRFPTEVVSPVMHWSPIHRAGGGKVPAQSPQDWQVQTPH